MATDEPAWTFQWTGAPDGDSWPVRVFYSGTARPDLVALAALADIAQQAHTTDALRVVLDGWAGDHGLTVRRFHAGADHLYPFGAVSVSFRTATGA